MKVNISGRGVIPGVGKVAPIYSYEMADNEIRRMLNFPAFRVYDSVSSKLITKKNVNDIIASHAIVNEAVVEVKNAPVAPKETVIEAPVNKPEKIEVIPEPVVFDEISNEEVVEESPVVEDVVEAVTDEVIDEDTDEVETASEDKPQYNYNKKKNKKNRH